jgi:hypothetical protein
MNLNVSKMKGNRIYLYFEKGYRDKETGKVKKEFVRALGYLDELEKEFADPIAHFKEVAKKMTEEGKTERCLSININMEEKLTEDAGGTKNLGYAVPLKVYHELGIDKFLKNKARNEKFEFNTNSIMILLVISRILSPGSKQKAYDEKGRYFERFDFSLDDVYRSLTYFDRISNELQRHLHESVRCKYGSDTSIIYYDVTNYYFEISRDDDVRKYSGNAKQKRKKPVVQLGLAMDKDAVPLHYELFPGNRLDKETFRSVIGNVRKNYDTGRVVVVADMGIITGDNIYYLVGNKPEKPQNGYVFSFSVRGGTDVFKKYVLDEDGYTDTEGKAVSERGCCKRMKVKMKYDKKTGKGKYAKSGSKKPAFTIKKHKKREKRVEKNPLLL